MVTKLSHFNDIPYSLICIIFSQFSINFQQNKSFSGSTSEWIRHIHLKRIFLFKTIHKTSTTIGIFCRYRQILTLHILTQNNNFSNSKINCVQSWQRPIRHKYKISIRNNFAIIRIQSFYFQILNKQTCYFLYRLNK